MTAGNAILLFLAGVAMIVVGVVGGVAEPSAIVLLLPAGLIVATLGFMKLLNAGGRLKRNFALFLLAASLAGAVFGLYAVLAAPQGEAGGAAFALIIGLFGLLLAPGLLLMGPATTARVVTRRAAIPVVDVDDDDDDDDDGDDDPPADKKPLDDDAPDRNSTGEVGGGDEKRRDTAVAWSSLPDSASHDGGSSSASSASDTGGSSSSSSDSGSSSSSSD